jgi:hypothetical protein
MPFATTRNGRISYTIVAPTNPAVPLSRDCDTLLVRRTRGSLPPNPLGGGRALPRA